LNEREARALTAAQTRERDAEEQSEKRREETLFLLCACVRRGEKQESGRKTPPLLRCPLCACASARELIKNLAVMINANYFFILEAESFAPQILLKINRMSGGARVFYEVLYARLLTRLSHAK
jgi:hypothetical protein